MQRILLFGAAAFAAALGLAATASAQPTTPAECEGIQAIYFGDVGDYQATTTDNGTLILTSASSRAATSAECVRFLRGDKRKLYYEANGQLVEVGTAPPVPDPDPVPPVTPQPGKTYEEGYRTGHAVGWRSGKDKAVEILREFRAELDTKIRALE